MKLMHILLHVLPQVKKVGDSTDERVKGLVAALDRLDSKVKANRDNGQRDDMEQVNSSFG